jgi:hypothetical protein
MYIDLCIAIIITIALGCNVVFAPQKYGWMSGFVEFLYFSFFVPITWLIFFIERYLFLLYSINVD